MAKVISTKNCKRRTIRLSSNDIVSIVKEYQQLMKGKYTSNPMDVLGDKVFYLPEEV